MGMTYDEARKQVLLFGGENDLFEAPYPLQDTRSWLWTTWAWHDPDPKPNRRSSMGLAFDRNLRQVVLFGGTAGDPRTWLWDGRAWSKAVPSTSPPTRWSNGMAWDESNSVIVMFGGRRYQTGYQDLGDTWTWDGADWTCVLECPGSLRA
jgi:hypothetical protein